MEDVALYKRKLLKYLKILSEHDIAMYLIKANVSIKTFQRRECFIDLLYTLLVALHAHCKLNKAKPTEALSLYLSSGLGGEKFIPGLQATLTLLWM